MRAYYILHRPHATTEAVLKVFVSSEYSNIPYAIPGTTMMYAIWIQAHFTIGRSKCLHRNCMIAEILYA